MLRPLSCIRYCEKHVKSAVICQRSWNSTSSLSDPITKGNPNTEYDAIIIGGGHNGLVSAAYLAKAGKKVCVLERRHLLGGAAVTEEIVPGFKFSRASYLLSLMRPQIIQDLELKKHGLKVYLRDPNSFTPLIEPTASGVKSLTLGRDAAENARQIAQFSQKDAQAYHEYEAELEAMITALDPLIDSNPPSLDVWTQGSVMEKWNDWPQLKALLKSGRGLGGHGALFYEFMTSPASRVLDKWFESEPLKATLATDSVIGAMMSPHSPGSGYVLLHHVMGELEGVKGAWGYVEGGMGAVSRAIARAAASAGAQLYCDTPVSTIQVCAGKATGVVLKDGTEIRAKCVMSNATPKVTFLDLIEKNVLPSDFVTNIHGIDYTSPVTKINLAVDRLPNFTALPNQSDNQPLPHHQTTIHINCESTDIIHQGYLDAQNGMYSQKPVIEMTIPSSVDRTVAPPGCHVVQLFTQYTPYTLAGGRQWDQGTKDAYADTVIGDIEKYAPGFAASVIGRDILTPPDIERIFGITGGNIFHGSMSLDQLYMARPTPSHCNTRTPVTGLYLCGSGAHPGGGVMGAPGRLAAVSALADNSV